MTAAMIICGLLTITSAVGVIFSRKALTSALWLIAALVLIAVHFALLGAQFLALLQILIYAGAIMVLMVFVVMLLGTEQGVEWQTFRMPSYVGAALCGLLGGGIIALNRSVESFPLAPPGEGAPVPMNAANLGWEMLTHYLLPFQLIGLLLFAAVVGAVILAKEERRPLAPGRGLRAAQERFAKAIEQGE